jgi:hypothetical protein
MTLDELNRVDVNDPAQVKALQNFLKSRGYYSKGLDGKWGGDTVEAVKALRGDLQAESVNRRAEAEARAAENSPAAEATRAATKFGPYVAGAGIGYGISRGMKKGFDAKDVEQKGVVSRLAADKSVNPIIAEQSLKAENRKRMMRTGAQFLAPAALAGISEVTRRYIAPQFQDERTREYVNLGATAEQAAGGTLAVKQLIDLGTRSSPNDPVDEARIRSRAAEARGDPYTVSAKAKSPAAAPSGPDPARMAELRAKRVADLRAEAKAMSLHSSGTKDDLVRRIAEAPPAATTAKPKRLPKGKAGLLAPFAAGAIAYDAATEDAEAAGLGEAETQGRGVAAGAGAAGLTAGASKLAPYAISAASKSMLGRAALRAVPPAAAALTAYDIGNYVGQSATPAPENDAFAEQYAKTHPRADPDAMVTQRMQARQAARMPMENASRLEVPPIRPGAAITAERNAVMNSGDFDAMLGEFMRAVEEHNAGIGGGEAYGP